MEKVVLICGGERNQRTEPEKPTMNEKWRPESSLSHLNYATARFKCDTLLAHKMPSVLEHAQPGACLPGELCHGPVRKLQ